MTLRTGALIFILCVQSLVGQARPTWRQSLNTANMLNRLDSPEAEAAYGIAAMGAGAENDGGAALALVRNDLSSYLLDHGRHGEAAVLLQQVLTVQEGDPRTAPRELAATLCNLGLCYRQQGRHTDAQMVHKRAVQHLEDTLGPRHADLMPALTRLAWFQLEAGRIEEAARLLARALRIGQASYGANDSRLGAVLSELSELQLIRADPGQARRSAARALPMLDDAYGPDSIEVARALDRMARADFALGRISQARESWAHSLKILETRLGPNADDTMAVLLEMAHVAYLERRYVEAEQTARRVSERAVRPPHASTILSASLQTLALVYVAQKRNSDASSAFQRSLEVAESTLPPSSLQVVACLAGYARFLATTGNLSNAEPVYRRAIEALDGVSTVDGSNHGPLLNLVEEQATVLRKLKRKPEARELDKRARALRASGIVNANAHTVDIEALKSRR